MPPPPPRNPVLSRAAITLLAGIAVFSALVLLHRFLIDDAFISFRYAKHLAQGDGLRFNLGEHPPVPGFSNLLWVLLLAGLASLGVALEPAALVLGWASGVLTLYLVRNALSRPATGGGRQTWPALALLCTLPMFVLWSSGGLETSFFALLALATYLAVDDRPKRSAWRLALLAVAMVATRVDGVVWLSIALFAAAVRERARTGTLPWHSIGLAFGAAALTLLAVHSWMYVYYGDWLQTTARSKGGVTPERIVRGLKYTARWLGSQAGLAVVLALGIASWRKLSPQAWGALAFTAGAMGYVVLVGGDWMPMWRFFVPAVPLLALLFGEWAARASAPRRWFGTIAVVALSAPSLRGHELLPEFLTKALEFRTGAWSGMSEYDIFLGSTQDHAVLRAVRAHTSPGESVIYGQIGALGYYTDLVLYDPLGLVAPGFMPRRPQHTETAGHDAQIAHSHFLSLHPTYRSILVLDPTTPSLDDIEAFVRGSESFPLELSSFPLPDGRELALFRYPDWSWIEELDPFIAAMKGIVPEDPDAVRLLEERLPTDSARAKTLRKDLRKLFRERLLANSRERASRVPIPERLHGFAIFAYVVRAGHLPARHESGAVHYRIPLRGRDEAAAQPTSWVVVPRNAQAPQARALDYLYLTAVRP